MTIYCMWSDLIRDEDGLKSLDFFAVVNTLAGHFSSEPSSGYQATGAKEEGVVKAKSLLYFLTDKRA